MNKNGSPVYSFVHILPYPKLKKTGTCLEIVVTLHFIFLYTFNDLISLFLCYISYSLTTTWHVSQSPQKVSPRKETSVSSYELIEQFLFKCGYKLTKLWNFLLISGRGSTGQTF